MKMNKTVFISSALMAFSSISLSGVARADASNPFEHIDAAKAASRRAEVLREPYARKARELSAEGDRLNNHAPFGCSFDGQNEVRNGEGCEAYHAQQKANFEARARNNVFLDRANGMLEKSDAAAREAEEKLAHARISPSNPDSESLRKLKELQQHFFFTQSAIQAFDDQQSSKSAFSRLMSKVKDKVVDHEREELVKRQDRARDEYLAELRRQGQVQLELRAGELAVSVPDVSEKALQTEDRANCAEAEHLESMVGRTWATIRSVAADAVDGARVRTQRSDTSRCGPAVTEKAIAEAQAKHMEQEAAPYMAPVETRPMPQAGGSRL